MRDPKPQLDHTVLLLGDGPVDPHQLHRAHSLAPRVIAADGGARHALQHNLPLTEIIGDLDSLTNYQLWRNSGTRITEVKEQNSTDFEKCLNRVPAATYIGLGFLGRRLDHSLACLRSLAAFPHKRIVLIGEDDITFLCPKDFSMNLAEDTRVSLFPIAPVTGTDCDGLRWSITGLSFDPRGQIGTSNQALGGPVNIGLSDAASMLMILPLTELEAAISALGG